MQNTSIFQSLKLFDNCFRDIQFCVVGGLAIRQFAKEYHIVHQHRTFNDIDIFVYKPKEVLSSISNISNYFQIYHLHTDPFFLALFDMNTNIKFDVFHDEFLPHQTIQTSIYGVDVKITSPEDQLIKTVFDTLRISEEKKVDPKQFHDVEVLMKITDLEIANKYWIENDFLNQKFSSVQDALNWSKQVKKQHPEWIQKHPFRKSSPYNCQLCQNHKYSGCVTDQKVIFQKLQYVE